MTGNEYQVLAARTINKNIGRLQREKHALFGMAGEVGELHSLYQKRYQGHAFDDEHAQKEVGDLLWMIAEYCTVRGWFLEDIMELNINKLRNRYPEGFSEENSLHRKDGDI
jgi:NTP pyrophosphatase (non-canonical NTP hydrolase)